MGRGSSAVIAAGLFFLAATSAKAQSPSAPIPNYFMVKLNISDLQKSLDFYTRILGLKEVRRSGGASPNAPLEVILSESGKDLESQVVLVYQQGKGPFQMGTALNTVVFIVPDVRGVAKRVADANYKVAVEPRDAKRTDLAFATGLTVAFVTDPDGYSVELLQWTR